MTSRVASPMRTTPASLTGIRHVAATALFLAFALSFVAMHVEEAIPQTLVLVTAAAIAGVAAAYACSASLRDPRLRRLADVFLLKVTLVLLFLAWGWIP